MPCKFLRPLVPVLLLGAILALLVLSQPPIAYAASITVAAGEVAVSANNVCSLIEAIINANADNQSGSTDCIAGSGTDTITLASNSTYTLTATNNTTDGNNGLPSISSPIIIEGNGSTIERSAAGGTPDFRLFQIAASPGALTVKNATIKNGKVSAAGNDGGAVYARGNLTLENCTVTGNSAADDAGAIVVFTNVNLTVTGCVFSNNSAAVPGGDGGAINHLGTGASTSNITITDSTFQSNTANRGGALFLGGSASQTTSVSGSTFTGNTAADDGTGGGAVLALTGTHSFTNSTFSGNTTNGSGGAIRNNSTGTINLNFVTIAGNTADNNTNGSGDGGGIINAAGGTINLKNSIVSDNIDNGAQAPDCSSTINSQDYNHIESTTGCTITGTTTNNVTGSDPALGALASNGGSTQTRAPAGNSVVLDTIPNGSNGCGTTPADKDQRSVARPADSDGNGTAACDKGAVEIGTTKCGIQAASEPAAYTFAAPSTVSINVTNDGTNLDCLRVTEFPTSHPNAPAILQTGKYWQINPLQTDKTTASTTDYTGDLTLPFAAADNSDTVCRYTGSGTTWSCTQSSFVANTSVTRTGITEFSDWAVGNQTPTSAVLTAFSAKVTPKQTVRLKWVTGQELNVMGFYVWRKIGGNHAGKAAQWVRYNTELVPATEPGNLGGANYHWNDKEVKHGKIYQYKIEVVKADGTSEWSETIQVKIK